MPASKQYKHITKLEQAASSSACVNWFCQQASVSPVTQPLLGACAHMPRGKRLEHYVTWSWGWANLEPQKIKEIRKKKEKKKKEEGKDKRK